MGEAYTQESYTKFNRHKERGTYDAETIHNIVNTTSVLHVSFADPASPFPIVLPMIGQIGQYATDAEPHLYLHGYVSSRIMNVTSSSTADGPSSEQQQQQQQPTGLPMTVSATKVDGLVLALSPFSHSYNYRSALIFGHAALLSTPDDPEVLWAMELITDSVVPGRWQHTRLLPTRAELASTRILKVAIASATAKIRTGPSKSERSDLRNPDVGGKIWQGVVPVWEHFGEPVTTTVTNKKDGKVVGEGLEVPEHVRKFVEAENENGEEYAVGVASEEAVVGEDEEGEE